MRQELCSRVNPIIRELRNVRPKTVRVNRWPQPLEEIPEVVGGRLPRLPPHHQLEFIEQLFVPFSKVWERGAQNGGHVIL